MTATVQLFAAARDAVGSPAATLELPAGATVAALRAALEAGFPELAALLPRCLVALNQVFADDAVELAAGDELALIPPVSGG